MTPVLQIIGILESKLAAKRGIPIGSFKEIVGEDGKKKLERVQRKKSVSQHIREKSSKRQRVTRRVKGAQRP